VQNSKFKTLTVRLCKHSEGSLDGCRAVLESMGKGMGQIRAVLCGYYGMGNGGDEALLAAMLQALPASVTAVVLSGDPATTAQRYPRVEVVARKDLGAVIRALQGAEVFIWGGGSLIQDATSWASPIYYTGLMLLAQRLGLKTIALAQGIGPLHRPLTRWLARLAFQGCTAVTVRDRGSVNYLARWGIPCTLAPDPVWALESVPVQGLWKLPAPRIAVSLRSHPQLTAERLQCLIQALVSFQQASRAYILLVPFQKAQDLAIAQQIQPHLSGNSQILMLEDPEQLKGIFRGVEMAIAMRLHGLIMAAAESCRCFALSYDPKVKQLMTEVELPGWEIAQIPNDPNQICQTWLEVYANGEPLSSDLIESLIDRALVHQEILRQVLAQVESP
jgi:polysaccharide pyruvyl transferase CsaB